MGGTISATITVNNAAKEGDSYHWLDSKGYWFDVCNSAEGNKPVPDVSDGNLVDLGNTGSIPWNLSPGGIVIPNGNIPFAPITLPNGDIPITGGIPDIGGGIEFSGFIVPSPDEYNRGFKDGFEAGAQVKKSRRVKKQKKINPLQTSRKVSAD